MNTNRILAIMSSLSLGDMRNPAPFQCPTGPRVKDRYNREDKDEKLLRAIFGDRRPRMNKQSVSRNKRSKQTTAPFRSKKEQALRYKERFCA